MAELTGKALWAGEKILACREDVASGFHLTPEAVYLWRHANSVGSSYSTEQQLLDADNSVVLLGAVTRIAQWIDADSERNRKESHRKYASDRTREWYDDYRMKHGPCSAELHGYMKRWIARGEWISSIGAIKERITRSRRGKPREKLLAEIERWRKCRNKYRTKSSTRPGGS